MVYATQTLAIDLGLLVSAGGFSDVTLENATPKGLDLNTTSTRLNMGVRWWLQVIAGRGLVTPLATRTLASRRTLAFGPTTYARDHSRPRYDR